MKKLHLIPLFIVLVLVIVSVAGCSGTARGGGWILSSDGGISIAAANLDDDAGKATFGFTCKIGEQIDEETYEATGNFQYNDHKAGYKIHGVITGTIVVDYDEPVTIFIGVIDPDKKVDGDEKELQVAVYDSGEPGREDWILVSVPGDNYENEGYLMGGNIQVFD
ncbi:MAG: post-COAP-1 domain-containing protein [Clostridiaceae bacterium]|nr:post-COAP-1 domain-containing protein [Clostridiaceae bacterium]